MTIPKAEPATPDGGAIQRPSSLTDLFLSFTFLALQGFGGVLAVVQRELVEKKRWMTREQFVEDWAVAQILPGPNVVNLSMMIGDRYFGLRGALVALAGMLAAPLVVVLMLALVYAQFAGNPQVAGALRGMGAVAAGLIAATGLKLFGVNATVAKVASGAAETVPYFMVTNLARTLGELKERNIWCIGTSDDAPKTVYQADLKGPVALVLGAEGQGMRQLTRKTCDELVAIPMRGAVESLNVSVASGVCLYEALRQRS